MTGTKLHTNTICPANAEFLDSIAPFSEKCPQLQVFLHREREDSGATDTEYLMVTPTTFGKVAVQDIQVEEPYIIIVFRDFAKDQVGHIVINVNNPDTKVLFINWQDIKEMVIAELIHKSNQDDLLDFNF